MKTKEELLEEAKHMDEKYRIALLTGAKAIHPTKRMSYIRKFIETHKRRTSK